MTYEELKVFMDKAKDVLEDCTIVHCDRHKFIEIRLPDECCFYGVRLYSNFFMPSAQILKRAYAFDMDEKAFRNLEEDLGAVTTVAEARELVEKANLIIEVLKEIAYRLQDIEKEMAKEA